MEKNVKQIKILALGDVDLLSNEEYIKKFIIDLVNVIEMQPLDKPFIYNVPLQLEKLGVIPFADSGGTTSQIVGFNTLSTSHLAMHSFPLENGKFYLDIFSCREFNLESVKKFVYDKFKCERMKITDLTYACSFDNE